MHRILPKDGTRHFVPLNPDHADTLVLSLHKDVIGELVGAPYEVSALLSLTLEQASQERGCLLDIKSPISAIFLAPLMLLSPGEVAEAADRLAARGFVERVGDQGVHVNALTACVIEPRQLSARFLMEWNAAKATCEESPGSTNCRGPIPRCSRSWTEPDTTPVTWEGARACQAAAAQRHTTLPPGRTSCFCTGPKRAVPIASASDVPPPRDRAPVLPSGSRGLTAATIGLARHRPERQAAGHAVLPAAQQK
ncbi:hypothetical protein [Streptomyces spectabilis]|uniref:Uncharacterized protein n=1 Tax=Streptomyces spectabilis TaxID=68270 RepID=A0A7W8B523_STRST|nr:hypothetical protein [Streptomyces spectabilis]MBB5109012.1 hypothetical protein [Streptomyces spectabilis]GGV50654.1 hypothetical protein GCM10010245_79840 [Streptomyces spectabilis]